MENKDELLHQQEQNMTKCKICGELKLRIQDGMYDHKNKRWIGEDGSEWNGRKCPSCQRAHMKNHQKTKRTKV
jgi:C4-type Zn-finger protein